MRSRWMWGLLLCGAAVLGVQRARADHEGRGSRDGFNTVSVPAAVSGGYWRTYAVPYYQTIGPDGLPITIVPRMPVGYPTGSAGAPSAPGRIPLAGPLPPAGLPRGGLAPLRPALGVPRKMGDPARAGQLTTYGDRLFRAGNTRRAAERFDQAARADPYAAGPRVRLAQVAIVRGQYTEAANQLRAAEAAEPGWLVKPLDVQSLYGEPADFAKQIARLESHVQSTPTDRDAWLVLGAQWYLSGRTRQAGDIFLRLSDRKPDPALAAFLEATRPAERAQR